MILESLRFRSEGLWSLEEKDLCSCSQYDENQILDLSLVLRNRRYWALSGAFGLMHEKREGRE